MSRVPNSSAACGSEAMSEAVKVEVEQEAPSTFGKRKRESSKADGNGEAVPKRETKSEAEKVPENNSKPVEPTKAFGFFRQTRREEHNRQHPDKPLTIIQNLLDFQKECAARWKTMNDREKMAFRKMADEDKKRYNQEIKHYVPPKKVPEKAKEQIAPKPKPKWTLKNYNAFYLFSECHKSLSKEELNTKWMSTSGWQMSSFQEEANSDINGYKKVVAARRAYQGKAPASHDDDEDEDDDHE